MGYNTTIFILNDGLDQIRKNPVEFVESLCHKIGMGQEGDIGAGYHANVAYVMKTQHADVPRLYFTQGNSIIELDEYGRTAKDVRDGRAEHYRDWLIGAGDTAARMLKRFREIVKKTS